MGLGKWKKRDTDEPEDHALGRSRGGLSSKIYLLSDRDGHPLCFHLIAGQIHESTMLDTVWMDADRHLFDAKGDPIAWPFALAGDKGYRVDGIDEYLMSLDISPVIPSKSN